MKKVLLVLAIVGMFVMPMIPVMPMVPVKAIEGHTNRIIVIDNNCNNLWDDGDVWFFDKNKNQQWDKGEVGGDFYQTVSETLTIINTTCKAFEDLLNNKFYEIKTTKPIFIDYNGNEVLDESDFSSCDIIDIKKKALPGDKIVIPPETIITIFTKNGEVHFLEKKGYTQTLSTSIRVGYCESEIQVNVGESIDPFVSVEYSSSGKQRTLWFPGFWGQWSISYYVYIDYPGWDQGYHLSGYYNAQGLRVSEIGESFWFGPSDYYDLYGTDYIIKQGEAYCLKFPTPTYQYLNLLSRAQGYYEVWSDETGNYEYVDDCDVHTVAPDGGHWILCL